MEYKNSKEFVLKELKKGNLTILNSEGLNTISIKEIIKQPIEGLLYDLNRDETTILTFFEDPKWINDYASTQVIKELLKQFNDLKDTLEAVKEERDELLKDKKAISNEKEMWKRLADKSSEPYFRKVLNAFCDFLINKEDGMYDICESNKKVIDEFMETKEV